MFESEEEALPEEKVPVGIPKKQEAPPAKGISSLSQMYKLFLKDCMIVGCICCPHPLSFVFSMCYVCAYTQNETNIFKVPPPAKRAVPEKKKPTPPSKEAPPLIQGN